MIYWGLSYGHHDASAVVMYDDRVVFARRYHSKDISNKDIDLLRDAYGVPDKIYLHENKWRDLWRKLKIGDWSRIKQPKLVLPVKPIMGNHHLSHAAAAFYTSGRKNAVVLVADAIGELESLAVYRAYNGHLHTTPLFQLKYPNSLGLFYSYHTAMIGMVPNRDENKLMEMSRRSVCFDYPIVTDMVDMSMSPEEEPYFICNSDIHKHPEEIIKDPTEQLWIASTTQKVIESFIINLLSRMMPEEERQPPDIIFTGGVAYNTLVCDKIRKTFNNVNVYVPSHPGDAGSSYGAILQHTHKHINLIGGVMFYEDKVSQK